MKIAQHLQKWRRFESVRSRLDPQADFELWFWATLSGGTALVNAALHAAGVTSEDELLATQIPHVYAFRDADGSAAQKIGFESDLIHVDVPVLDADLPPDLERAFAAVRVIETLRDPCIRSDAPVTPMVVDRCVRSHAELVEALGPRLRAFMA